MNLNMLLKLGNLICAHADFNNNNINTYMYTKIHIYLGKSEYHHCFSRLPYLYIYFSLFS